MELQVWHLLFQPFDLLVEGLDHLRVVGRRKASPALGAPCAPGWSVLLCCQGPRRVSPQLPARSVRSTRSTCASLRVSQPQRKGSAQPCQKEGKSWA